MLNDNVFPNAGSITGSGGPTLSGSGIYLELDYGLIYPNSVAPIYIYQSGILQSVLQGFNNISITGSGGPTISGSGIFLYLDYAFPSVNGQLIITEEQTGVIPPIAIVLRPYAYYFKKK